MKRLFQFAGVAAALMLAVAVVWFVVPHGEGALRNRAIARRQLAIQVMGEYLAERMPGANTLVLGNPFTQLRGQTAEVYAYEDAALKGFKNGGRDRLVLCGVEYPELMSAAVQDPSLVPIPADTTTPLSFLCVEGSWDRVLAKHPGVELVVSLIGLPADIQRLAAWKDGRPKFAFIFPDFRVLGDVDAVVAAFKSGKIIAAVVNHPNAPPESEPMARAVKDEFERRFILVNAGNCEVVLRALSSR
ncbi:MAG: hypothetical protein GX456_06110 [Verrucomicrobia bacterium]|nr:hypothetical protein [Verrucomicrobiota bacterium]